MRSIIKACQRCGSRDLKVRGWSGVMYICQACKWRGNPFEFTDVKEWEAFVEAQRQAQQT